MHHAHSPFKMTIIYDMKQYDYQILKISMSHILYLVELKALVYFMPGWIHQSPIHLQPNLE